MAYLDIARTLPDIHNLARVSRYNLNPLTKDLLARLGRERSLDEPAEDISEIGYPSAS